MATRKIKDDGSYTYSDMQRDRCTGRVRFVLKVQTVTGDSHAISKVKVQLWDGEPSLKYDYTLKGEFVPAEEYDRVVAERDALLKEPAIDDQCIR